MTKTFSALFFYMLTLLSLQAADDSSLQNYCFENRLGQVLKRHSSEMLIPEFKTANEAVGFARAFSEGEMHFWQDTILTFRSNAPRLNIILNIVESAIKKLPEGSSKLAKINTEYKMLTNLYLSPHSTVEDKNQHEIYKSYREALDYYEEIATRLSLLEKTEDIDIKNVIASISSFMEEKRNYYGLKKKLLTRSCVKEIDKELRSQQNYYICDLHRIITSSSEILLPILNSYNLKETARAEKIPQQPTKNSSKSSKKKKRGKPKRAVRSDFTLETPTSSLLKAVEPVQPIQKKLEILMETPSSSLEGVSELDAAPIANAPEVPLLLPSIPTGEKPEETSQELADVNDAYVVNPWDNYPKIKRENTNQKRNLTKQSSQLVITPKISDSEKEVLLAFFSTEKLHVNTNVSMQAFLDLISSQFNGYVYRTGENLHFMAKHAAQNKWYSVCMHVLHKDKSQYIPRNTTYYWKRAKTLLENVGALDLLKSQIAESA